MATEAGKIIEVKCPCCNAALRIDTELELVLSHKEPEKKPLIDDLRAAVQGLQGEAARRNEAFEKSFASHLTGEKVRERKFDELLKQAREDTSGSKPRGPFDLD